MNICSEATNPLIDLIKHGSHQISFIAKNSHIKQKFIDGLLGFSLEYYRPHTTTEYAVKIHGTHDNIYRIQIDDGHTKTFESKDNLVQYIKVNRQKCESKMTLFLPQLRFGILDNVVLHDAKCFNFSDELNEVIIEGCQKSCTIIVVLSAIGGIGYQEEMFLMTLMEKCPDIFKVIFVFTDVDRVPKNEQIKNKEHHTDCVKKLMARFSYFEGNGNILFIGTNNEHVDDFKSMLPNYQNVNGHFKYLSHYTSGNLRTCTQLSLIRTNDIEYMIENHSPQSSRFDKHCLMLFVRFVSCMIRWNGCLDVRQLKFTAILKDMPEMLSFFKSIINNNGLVDKYGRSHCHTQLSVTISDIEHERCAQNQYFEDSMVKLTNNIEKYQENLYFISDKQSDLLIKSATIDRCNQVHFKPFDGFVHCHHMFLKLIDELKEVDSNFKNHVKIKIELRNDIPSKIKADEKVIQLISITRERLIQKIKTQTVHAMKQLNQIELVSAIDRVITRFYSACRKFNDGEIISKMKDNINDEIPLLLPDLGLSENTKSNIFEDEAMEVNERFQEFISSQWPAVPSEIFNYYEIEDGLMINFTNNSFKIYQENRHFLSEEQSVNMANNSFDTDQFCQFIKDLSKCIDTGFIRSRHMFLQLNEKLEEVHSILNKHLRMKIELREDFVSQIKSDEKIIHDMNLKIKRFIYGIKTETEYSLELLKQMDLKSDIIQMITSFNGSCNGYNAKEMISNLKDSINKCIIQILQKNYNDNLQMETAKSISDPNFGDIIPPDFTLSTNVNFIDIEMNIFWWWEFGDKTEKVKKHFHKHITDQFSVILVKIYNYYKTEITRFETNLFEQEFILKFYQIRNKIYEEEKLTHVIEIIGRLSTDTRDVIGKMKSRLKSST